MAWAFVQELEISLEDFDRIAEAVGDDPPEGLIVHVAGRHGSAVRVIDVWESEEDYNRFRDGRLTQAVEGALGAGAMTSGPPPNTEAMEVHHLIRGR
jgi:hypothetical protein